GGSSGENAVPLLRISTLFPSPNQTSTESDSVVETKGGIAVLKLRKVGGGDLRQGQPSLLIRYVYLYAGLESLHEFYLTLASGRGLSTAADAPKSSSLSSSFHQR